jgi:hypothetical protein
MSETNFYVGQTFKDVLPAGAAEWAKENHCIIREEWIQPIETHIQFNMTNHVIPGQGPEIYLKYEIIKDPNYIPPEQILKEYEAKIQEFLDQTAQSRGYDNTYTCLSYLNSKNEIWYKESHIFSEWRDDVWLKTHEILNQYLKGEIEQPSIEEVIEQLPKIEW